MPLRPYSFQPTGSFLEFLRPVVFEHDVDCVFKVFHTRVLLQTDRVMPPKMFAQNVGIVNKTDFALKGMPMKKLTS